MTSTQSDAAALSNCTILPKQLDRLPLETEIGLCLLTLRRGSEADLQYQWRKMCVKTS